MGIGGLLPLLKEIQKPCHVKDWAGKRIAVDSYVWLHRGAYGCAEDLALGRPTVKYVNYAMHRVRMLKYFGVTPVMVFDGGLLPSKMGTEDEREKRRAEALAKGNAFRTEGKASLAREAFVKAVDVTPAMAYQLIKASLNALRAEGIEYVVAPYEADPQLAYLEKSGFVDAVVTEDSDLLVFGCRNVLFKLDGEGNCVSISRNDFSKCREYNLAGWSDDEFRHMAILSGCDYLDSVVGLGLKTAHRLLRKYKKPEKVIQFVRLEGNLNVPRSYLDDFRRAELTFLHQHVFDPRTKSLTHLTPLPAGTTLDDLPFIGPLLAPDFALGVALGDIDPITKERVVDLVPSSFHAATVTPRKNEATIPKAKGPKPATRSGGTLLSFFSRRAGTPTAINPVKAIKTQARVTLVESAKENKPAVPPQEEPARASKFFGAGTGGKAAQQKSSATAAAPTVVPEPPQDAPSDDFEAEAALRDIELDFDLRSAATNADEADQAVGERRMSPAEAATIADRSALCNAQEQAVNASGDGIGSIDGEMVAPVSPPPTSEASVDTPSPERQKVPIDASEQSDSGVSSPADSNVAHAGWPTPGLDQSPGLLSSPIAARDGTSRSPPPVVKQEAAAPTTSAPLVSLSSDPIILSSDTCSYGQQATPRPPKRSPRPPKQRKSPVTSAKGKLKAGPSREARSKTVAVWEDTPGAKRTSGETAPKASARKKRKETEAAVVDVDEGISEAVRSVAASWRAKFMLQTAVKTTPRLLAPAQPPTPASPTTASRQKATRTLALAHEQPSVRASAPRTPLSALGVNSTSLKRSATTSAIDEKCPARGGEDLPPAKKRRTVSALDCTVDRARADADVAASSSSSPVAITNPRLLAFRFTGTVRRD